MRTTLNKRVQTDLGKMTVKDYLDECVKSKAIFWEAKRDVVKRIRYFAALGRSTMELNKTMYDYAMSKVDYKFNAITGYGE